MSEFVSRQQEISKKQQKVLAGRTLAALGLGVSERWWQLARAYVGHQDNHQWARDATYEYRGLTERRTVWFNYEISTLGTKRPEERFSVVMLHNLTDDGVTDRRRTQYTFGEGWTTYRSTLQVFDPVTETFLDASFNPHALISPEVRSPVERPAIAQIEHAELEQIFEHVDNGTLARQYRTQMP